MLSKEDLEAIGGLMDQKLAAQKSDIMQEMAAQKSDIMQEMAVQKSDIMQEMDAQKSDIMQEMAAQKSDLMQEMAAQKSDIMQEMAAQKSDIMQEMAAQKSDIMREVSVLMESKFQPQFNLLAEGQRAIIEKLDSFAPKSRLEELEDKVGFLESIVVTHAKEIAALKKAN